MNRKGKQLRQREETRQLQLKAEQTGAINTSTEQAEAGRPYPQASLCSLRKLIKHTNKQNQREKEQGMAKPVW